MDIMNLLELGLSGAMLIVLVWIVKAFLSHLKAKDEVFSQTINNHLSHSVEAQTKLTGVIDELKDVVKDKL